MSAIVPKGVAYFALQEAPDPECFTFVLLPQFSMLSFSAAIEPLRMANQVTGKALFQWQVLSEDGRSVDASNGVSVTVDGALSDISRSHRIFVCAGGDPEAQCRPVLLSWLRRQARQGVPLGALCTGSYALARAGLLEGHKFTLHWEHLPGFEETYFDLRPSPQLFVVTPKLWTCGGGAAATDMCLTHIRTRFGLALAQTVQDMCLHLTPRADHEAQRSNTAAALGTRNPKLSRAIDYLTTHLSDDLDLETLATAVGVSRRHLERLFTCHAGVSPRRFLTQLRLDRARSILAETDLSITEVAHATGFNSTATLSKNFKNRFGISPHQFCKGEHCVPTVGSEHF